MASIRKRPWVDRSGKQHVAWQVSYLDQRGKRRRKQFARRKDADSFLVRARSEVEAGIHNVDRESITVREAGDIWIDSCKLGRGGRNGVELHTLRQYQQHLEHHIAPLIGSRLLSKLTTPEVMAFRDDLLRTRSRTMAKKIMTSFKAILGEAQMRGLVAQNVASVVSVTNVGRHKSNIQIPTRTDIKSILSEVEKKANCAKSKGWRQYQIFLTTAVLTGMRASELRGLKWENIDLLQGSITVRQRADERGFIGALKSMAARRNIDIPPHLVQLLCEWKLACPPGSLDLVFPNGNGNVEALANLHSRYWKPLLTECGFIDDDGRSLFKFHSLRHFRASALIAAGASPKEVMTEIGHSSITLTFDTYGHLFPEDTSERKSRAAALAADIMH